MKIISNRKIQKSFRKRLRNSSTPAEIPLWSIIKGKQISGRKFRRQYGIGIYVLDFYCASEKLAIELDGNDHFTEEGLIKDAKRDSYLSECGITVLRIENKAVFENTEQVIQLMQDNFRK